MSVRAIVAPGEAREGEPLPLDASESHYLLRVRRRRKGDSIELLDGEGGHWQAHLLDEDPKRTKVLVGPVIPRPPSGPALQLLLGYPDPKVTLEILAQACELNVSEVVLLRCERSQDRTPSTDRIERVLRSAQRQCGRPTPLGVVGPLSLGDALALRPEWPGFFAWEKLRGQSDTLQLSASSPRRALVGPEGGFTPSEVESIKNARFEALSLGPWTLRSETAAVALLARLSLPWAPSSG